MTQVIRVSTETYERLEEHAKGFDTPSNVIDKLLNHYDGISKPTMNKADAKKRDGTKYRFNHQIYGKGRLVLSTIKTYVLDNPTINFNDLLDIFPKDIQGSSGVFLKIEEAQIIYNRTNHKRHFIKEEEVIVLSDCTIAVSTEWGVGNINDFIFKAREIGCDIQIIPAQRTANASGGNKIMTKQETIQLSNKWLNEEVLNNQNTHFANINNATPVWWLDIPLEKFGNDLYLILNEENSFILLKISANIFENLDEIFKIKQERWVDLEISSNRQNNYLIDVKSGGTNYNFNPHVEYYEFD